MRITLRMCVSIVAMLAAIDAGAYSGYLGEARIAYPVIVGTPLNACILCHISPGPPAEPALNPYGIAYLNSGLSFTATDSTDSDGDQFANGYEINHLTFPGDPASAPPAYLSVLAPNGGEYWERGTSHGITWTSPGLTGNVRIFLYNNWTKVRALATVPASAGVWTWSVPVNDPNLASCRIRMQSLTVTTLTDYSDRVFGVGAARTLRLTSPNGGEQWSRGYAYPITWSFTGGLASVNIGLYNNWTRVRTLAIVAPASGAWLWSIPVGEPLLTTYRVRVQTIDGVLSDYGDGMFSVTGAVPSLAVSAPNGGETW